MKKGYVVRDMIQFQTDGTGFYYSGYTTERWGGIGDARIFDHPEGIEDALSICKTKGEMFEVVTIYYHH